MAACSPKRYIAFELALVWRKRSMTASCSVQKFGYYMIT